jgi:nicotinamidase/pyrazinamidase
VSEDRDKRTAFIVVDPQPDFFEGGALPVPGATTTATRIAEYLQTHGEDYSLKIVTQDWHLDPGSHWSQQPDFVTTWPVHCIADSDGARIHPALAEASWDVVIRKGQHSGAYSGFEGTSDDGSTLADVLGAAGVDTVTIVGFATDHCVKATALDARALGYQVNVALDLCAGVDPDTSRDAVTTMRDADIAIVSSGDL